MKKRILGIGGQIDMDERDVSQKEARPTLWLWILNSSMTLTFDFKGQIFKKLYLKEGRVD